MGVPHHGTFGIQPRPPVTTTIEAITTTVAHVNVPQRHLPPAHWQAAWPRALPPREDLEPRSSIHNLRGETLRTSIRPTFFVFDGPRLKGPHYSLTIPSLPSLSPHCSLTVTSPLSLFHNYYLTSLTVTSPLSLFPNYSITSLTVPSLFPHCSLTVPSRFCNPF